MRMRIVAVGKVKQAGMRAELDMYLGRIRRYCTCEELELKDASEAELVQRIQKLIPERSRTVALDVEGRQWSSHQFARFVEQSSEAGGTMVWLIGGAYGLQEVLRRQADLKLSLSQMTLPHRLARLVFVEQLYRAYSIIHREPYSH